MGVRITESAEDMENMRCFITAWQMSSNIDEVLERYGALRYNLAQRHEGDGTTIPPFTNLKAYEFQRALARRLGVRLKHLRRNRSPSISAGALAMLRLHAENEYVRYRSLEGERGGGATERPTKSELD